MTFTQLELLDWALQTCRREFPDSESAQSAQLVLALVVGYLFGVRTSHSHLRYATDRRRVQNLIEDAEKTERALRRG